MTDFVLVHGTWGGGWQWRPVAARLQAAGHRVFTPTLTGLGERSHLAAPDIDLDTHIDDVVGVLACEELSGVALVGTSYGGLVIAGVAARMPERIRTLVFLDAALPQDGKSMLDLVPAERRATVERLAREEGGGYLVPTSLVLDTGIADPSERAAYLARMSAHPLRALQQPVRFAGRWQDVPRKAYVLATLQPTHHFVDYHAWAARTPGWSAHELASDHFPMTTMPRETADLLMALAG
ncbi:MAG TPA: alpha/beta hydrolase [Xanthobacteraceae bacterium]|nr:alpha/beta hydrolase [Xanthobacteraceae bacterium]